MEWVIALLTIVVSVATASFGWLKVREDARLRVIEQQLDFYRQRVTELQNELAMVQQELEASNVERARLEDRLENTLKERHTFFFQAVMDNASAEAIIIADSRGRVLEISPGAALLLGYAESELIGESIEKIMPQRFVLMHRQAFESAVKDGRRIRRNSLPLFVVRRTGEVVAVSISLLGWKRGDESFFVGVVRPRVDTQNVVPIVPPVAL